MVGISRFYRCDTCGQIIAVVKGFGFPTSCCGNVMEFITPNDVDASLEKHVPIVIENNEDNTVLVKVGSEPHPSSKDHYIEWISVETNKGVYFKRLMASSKPEVTFTLDKDEKIVDVFAYCNIHGLWKAKIKNN